MNPHNQMSFDGRRHEVPIRMSFTSPMGFRTIPTLAYEIKRTKPWSWLQGVCVHILRSTGALSPHFDQEMLVKSVILEPNSTAMQIVRMAEDQLARVQYRPERILIGRKQFEQITSMPTPDIFREFSFDIPMGRSTPGWNGLQPKLERFGVSVYVIPWMDGVLVL